MAYRLIAADMDGTLLNSRKQITPLTEAAVRRASEAGCMFCLSTGRPLCGVRRYIEQLQLDSPAILYNGAVIAKPDSTVLYECGLDEDSALEIYDFAVRFGTTLCVWSKERLFVSEINERTDDYKKLSGVEPQVIEDFRALAREGITKMLWYDDFSRMDMLQTVLRSELKSPVSFATSNPRFLEFFNSAVSKAAAMERLGELYGIAQSEMMAIGDGENDLSMLGYAGLAVAMENAVDSVKSRCGFITASNDEDGVALAIERFVL